MGDKLGLWTNRYWSFSYRLISLHVMSYYGSNLYTYLLYTYWDLHTEKPQSKFSFAGRCKPIKCRVSLFPHVRKAIRPIGSRVSCFFTIEPYGKWELKFTFKAGWRGFVHRTSHRFASLKRANSFYSHFFHRWYWKFLPRRKPWGRSVSLSTILR